jgi:alanyl-tRNA synthetase
METEKLYYENAFLREFEAGVLSCAPEKGGWAVVLDRTAFYPEGGGQPADRGSLGGVPVADVQERGGQVVHLCESPLEPGARVTGVLDWDRRFDHMQQHSGEHILSGVLRSLYGCDNVGFHLGADTVTIDYNRELTDGEVLEAERLANEAVYQNAKVEIDYPGPEALAQLNYRSKKELFGRVRIVRFPGADCCACCGTHVLRAGQVGLIKVLSCQKFREGARLEIVCGGRAFRYLAAVVEQNREISRSLSVKPLETAAAAERLKAELAGEKARVFQLEETMFASLAEESRGKGDTLLFREPMRPDAVRRLADAVARASGGRAAVFSGEGGCFSYALIRSDGGDVSALVKKMNAALRGRGGGRGGAAQGSVEAERSEIEAFFQTV